MLSALGVRVQLGHSEASYETGLDALANRVTNLEQRQIPTRCTARLAGMIPISCRLLE